MSKYNFLTSDFSAGEISPRAEGKEKTEDTEKGAALLQNFIPTVNGPEKRLGSRYVAALGAFTHGIFSFPFTTSKTVAYKIILETNGKEGTVYRNDGINFGITSTVHILAELDPDDFHFVQSSDVMLVTHASSLQQPFIISRTPATSSSLETFAITPFIAQIRDVLNIPFRDVNINGEKVLNPSGTTGSITVGSEDSASGNIDFFSPDHLGSIFRINQSGTTGAFYITAITSLESSFAALDVDLLNDQITITGHGYITGDKIYFKGGPSGLEVYAGDKTPPVPYYVIKIDNNIFEVSATPEDAENSVAVTLGSATLGIVYLSDGTKANSCTATVINTLVSSAATDSWEEGAWSNYQGWPKSVTLFEQSSFFGGSTRSPDIIWKSLTGNLYHLMGRKFEQDSSSDSSGVNYFGPVEATDSFFFGLTGSETPVIQWLSSEKVIQCGTLGLEYIISGGSSAISAVPGALIINTQTAFGSSDVQPIRAGNSVLFVSRERKRLRNFKFNEANGSYVAENLSLLSDDIIMNHGKTVVTDSYSNASIKKMTYQLSKDLIWMRTSRDVLVCFTYEEIIGIRGWSRHTIGGSDVKVLSIAAMPSNDGSSDELWIIVQRTINSLTVTYLEKINSSFDNNELTPSGGSVFAGTNITDRENDYPWYSDSCIVKGGSQLTTWSGFSHLEGEEVSVLADGIYQGDFTVTAGDITITNPADQVIVGLKYVSRLKTKNISTAGDFGTPEGNKQRVDRAFLRLYNSFGGKIGRDFDELEDLEYALTTEGDMFTGGIRALFNGTPDEIARICIEHSDPLPFNLLSLTTRGVNYD